MRGIHAPMQESAGNTVYYQLKKQIVNMELPPGTALSEKEMSITFNVSRTPVRESFVRLAQEGLVLVLPQRGTRVSLIDPDLVLEAQFMREQLERAVIRLACKQFSPERLDELKSNLSLQQESFLQHDGMAMFELDEQFHRILFEGVNKLGTWTVIQQMNAHLNRSRILWMRTEPRWEHLFEQHRDMYEAICQKDEALADRLMEKHLALSIYNLGLLQKKFPDYFKQPTN